MAGRGGRRNVVIGLVFGFIQVFAVAAISIGSVDFQGAEPKEPMRDSRFGGAIPVYSVVPGKPLLNSPGGAVQGEAGKWLALHWLLRKAEHEKKVYYLVGRLDDQRARVTSVDGWISEDDALLGTEAMKTDDGIYRKALVINRWAVVGQRKELDRATVFQGPSEKSKVLGKQGLFQFFFIWKKVDGYWLVGGRSRLTSDIRPDDSLVGWIKEDRLLEWNTRQAVQFNKTNLNERKEPVSIYSDKSELFNWLKGKSSATPPIATEVLNVKSWEPHWMRFPLLAAESIKNPSTNRFLKVAYIGDQIAVDSGASIDSAWAGASDYQKLEQMKAMVKNIDILLVIDATGSMFEIFPFVEKAIGKVFTDLDRTYGKMNSDRPDIRFSIVFYRDYHDPATTIKHLQLTDDAEEAMAYMRNEPVRPGEGSNPDDRYEYTEAMFYAICEGLAKTKFRKGSFRQVIVIGDRGNHPVNKDKLGYSERNVVDALLARDADLLGLHLADASEIEKDAQTRLFKDQFYRIYQMIRSSDASHLVVRYMNNPRHSEVAGVITDGADKATESSERIKESIKSLQRGDNIALVEEQYGVAISSRLVQMMKKVGMNPEDFRKSKAQICEEGWIAQTNPKSGYEQIETMLLVRQEDLVQLAAILNRLCSTSSRQKANLRHTWKSVLEEEIGEDIDFNKNIDDLVRVQGGLPVRMKLLRFTIDDLMKKNPRELEKIVERMRSDRDTLMDLLTAGDKIWWSREGLTYGWIKREMLP